MGLEGLSYIGEDIDQINYYYDEFGVRDIMVTWNEENALGSGWPGDKNRGLTPKGKEAIKRMNELGIVLDVSHLNDKDFWDIIELSMTDIRLLHPTVTQEHYLHMDET